MNYPYQITVLDYQRLKDSNDDIKFGHYFVFRQVHSKPQGRLARLCSSQLHQEVLPLVNESMLAVGDDVKVKLAPRPLELVGCLVSNRDLYRAERDPVHLFIAVPHPPAELRLQVTWNGTSFCHRVVTLQESVAIETFALLLPGRYTAQLTCGAQRLGRPVNFTVAEYQLAPLTGRLVSHQLDHESQYLWFELAVDSYQQPFAERLIVELIEEGKTIDRIGLLPATPGQYTGGLPLSGEKALRLRLIAAADPDKIAEVVIPGSRKQERQVSVISELGQEFRFAMMPEAQAIPLRGGYLSKGEEVLASPLLVEEIVTNHRLLQVKDNVEALALVNLDLITGVYSTQLIGNVSAGTTINVASTGTMSMTFAGGFVDGEPFEAYTTFIQPTHFNLSVDTPSTLKPRDNLVIRLGCEGVSETVPVLVCVRDARLTATEMPAVSLGASVKRNIDAALVDMNEWSFVGWQELAPSPPRNLSPQVVLDNEIMEIFLDEAEEILENAQLLLERWKTTPHNMQLVEELHRKVHTLKGSARAVGISAMADLSHSLESVLIRIREGGVQSNSKLQEVVQNSVDELAALLEAVRSGVPLERPTYLIALTTLLAAPASASLAPPPLNSMPELAPLSTQPDATDEFTANFLENAEEILENTQSLVGRWQATPDNLQLVKELQREVHTLKGGARIVGISAMAELSHSLDSVLTRIVEGGAQSNSKLQEVVQNSVDELAAMLEAVRSGVPPDVSAAPLSQKTGLGKEMLTPLTAAASSPVPPAAMTSKPAPSQTRTEFPEMLFYGLVPVTGTTHDLVLPVGEALTTWVVETFALRHGDWAQARTTVVIDQPVRIDLEVPPAVYPQDNVVGRLHVVTASGTARLRLHCDGQPVELRSGQLTWCNPDSIVTPAELEFSVTPGHYCATVEDLHTHDTDSIETIVQEPTKIKSYMKALHLLQSGETVTLDSAKAVTLHLLPTLDTPFNALITATADYGHLCCEQTAAKILAATLMYLTASEEPPRRQAEQIILTGIAREQKMFRPGRGFAMYPDGDYFSEHYSQCAVFYLWRLQPLEALPDLSSSLRQAVQEGLDMANQAAVVHQLQRIPDRINQIEDAYTLATLQKMPEAIYQYIDSLIDFTGTEVRLRNSSHLVADRTLLAYTAASLIALKDWQRGLRLANQVTRQFNAQGCLYSTVDSVAALVLLQQLKLANIAMGTGQLRVNSKAMTLEDTLTLAEPVTSVEVVEGVAAVEVTYPHTEDWESFGQPFPITVDFRETDSAGKQKKRFALGNRLTLHIALPQGYRLGDIAHIVLPPCLSAIEGGAKVKRFTLDFAGRNELQIPLLVTAKLQGVQHFAVCVRNMFEEERASSTGLLTVTDGT